MYKVLYDGPIIDKYRLPSFSEVLKCSEGSEPLFSHSSRMPNCPPYLFEEIVSACNIDGVRIICQQVSRRIQPGGVISGNLFVLLDGPSGKIGGVEKKILKIVKK